jgi:hypothetical protein
MVVPTLSVIGDDVPPLVRAAPFTVSVAVGSLVVGFTVIDVVALLTFAV